MSRGTKVASITDDVIMDGNHPLPLPGGMLINYTERCLNPHSNQLLMHTMYTAV